MGRHVRALFGLCIIAYTTLRVLTIPVELAQALLTYGAGFLLVDPKLFREFRKKPEA